MPLIWLSKEISEPAMAAPQSALKGNANLEFITHRLHRALLRPLYLARLLVASHVAYLFIDSAAARAALLITAVVKAVGSN